MLRSRRPRKPKGFAAEVAGAERVVKRAIAAGRKLDGIADLWRGEKYKRAFAAAQHGKCGYCETFVLNHPAHMEHHAPKGKVHILVDDGEEVDGLNNVPDRLTLEICATGYHWLVYAWENWLLACERCNSRWKGSLFPTREDLDAGLPQAVDSVYRMRGIEAVRTLLGAHQRRSPRRKFTPLLLHPFGPEDAADHLEFNEAGEIAPRAGSDIGRETIRTCGLHRESLRRARQPIAEYVFRLIERLEDAGEIGDRKTIANTLADLLLLGAEDRAHAGMVRAIVLSELELRWEDLERLVNKLPPKPSTRTNHRRSSRT